MKIIAPLDFEILKSDEELENERREVAGAVLPVVIRVDSVGVNHRRELLRFSTETHEMLSALPPVFIDSLYDSTALPTAEDSLTLQNGIDQVFNSFGFRPSSDTWRFLRALFLTDRINLPGQYFQFFEGYLEEILRNTYGQGVVNVPKTQIQHPTKSVMMQYEGEETVLDLKRLLTPSEALERISILLPEHLADTSYPAGAISAAYDILQPFVSPNVVYDAAETESRRNISIAKVPLAKGLVKKDELIIDSNIRVSREHIDKLRSLAIKRSEEGMNQSGIKALLPIFGHFFLMLLIISFFWTFIALGRTNIWRDWKLMLVITIVFAAIHSFDALILARNELSYYLFPAAVLAMLLNILVDRGVSLVGVVVMALIVGLLRGNDFPAAVTAASIGAIAILSIRRVRTRGDVMRATGYLAATFIPIVAGFHFISFTTKEHLWQDFMMAGINTVMSPILALGLVLIFEIVFRITTEFSLLELVDLNRPLLKNLAFKSPGTYHHSIMVGSLAETAATAINANALLTRAGAYYHDIGKIENREYFIENQEAGSENIHDRMPPSKSAEIVIKHVMDGLELADAYRLPRQVKAFISEHHGRSRLAYFYDKARRELGDDVIDSRFRYPGPNPQTKETGILMLADLVEAATRTLEYTTNEELEEIVNELVKNRLADGDLDDCPLNLREINQVKRSFVQVLAGIHHQRIPYPGQKQPGITVQDNKAEHIDNPETEHEDDST